MINIDIFQKLKIISGIETVKQPEKTERAVITFLNKGYAVLSVKKSCIFSSNIKNTLIKADKMEMKR